MDDIDRVVDIEIVGILLAAGNGEDPCQHNARERMQDACRIAPIRRAAVARSIAPPSEESLPPSTAAVIFRPEVGFRPISCGRGYHCGVAFSVIPRSKGSIT